MILSVQQLYKIEENLKVLNYSFSYKNILMWPFIRFSLFQNTINKMFSINLPHTSRLKVPFSRLIPYVKKSFANDCLACSRQFEILIFSSGIVNIKNSNGLYFNRLYDHFAQLYENQTLIIEGADRGLYYRPRFFHNVLYQDAILIKTFLKSLLYKVSALDQSTISAFIVFLKKIWPIDLETTAWDTMTWILLMHAKCLPEFHLYYKNLLEKIRPKILILEDACYGNRSYIIKWAKEMGVVTGEFQHGLIDKNHPAYNFHPHIAKSPYLDYLPDHFLSHGKYWSASIQIPSQISTVGNPYLIEFTNQYHRQKCKKKKIVVISSGTRWERLMNLTLALRRYFPMVDYEIIFRPHPLERDRIPQRYRLLIKNRVQIDSDNLYQTLSQADYLIGTDISTVFFEAMRFQIPIFVQDDPYVAYYANPKMFILFQGISDLLTKIETNSIKTYNSENIWDSGWKSNYQEFITRHILD